MQAVQRLKLFFGWSGGKRRPLPEEIAAARRPSLPVASILRDLDEIFGLDLKMVGQIISSGNTISREEIYANMLEWAQGANSEFAKSKYMPRLVALLDIVQVLWHDFAWHDVLPQALVNPLPQSVDAQRRSIAGIIQADDYGALDSVKTALLQK